VQLVEFPRSVGGAPRNAATAAGVAYATDLLALEEALASDDVTEIMRNPDGGMWLDTYSQGMVRLPAEAEMTDDAVESFLRILATATNRQVSSSCPEVQAELGYPFHAPVRRFRVQGILPPWVERPTFAIRKPGVRSLTFDDYMRQGALSAKQVHILTEAVWNGETILIGGKGGVGKTTLADAILQEVCKTGERLYTIEDARELRCTAQNSVSVCVPKEKFGHAVEVALRCRIDRIIVGEVRHSAALDMINAWNTAPGLGTLHARTPQGMLERICQLIPAASCPPRAVIAETIDLMVHVSRDLNIKGGRRVVVARPKTVRDDGTFEIEVLG
jgi:Flp pilus assembly CpaF family ATPase